MSELQVFFMGMWHSIYIEPFEGLDTVLFTIGMGDHIIQLALLAYYGTLVPILFTLVGRKIQVATQVVAHLREIKLARQKQWV